MGNILLRRSSLGASFALAACVSLVFAPSASADPIPPGAQKPVKQTNSTIVTKKLEVNWFACFNSRSNPRGYVWHYTRYSGHSYVDARGVGFYGYYQTFLQVGGWKTVVGPFTVHSKVSWKECARL
ncbi:hypothetical protein ACWD3J_15450 [Streptomyces sp. NPDC002755]